MARLDATDTRRRRPARSRRDPRPDLRHVADDRAERLRREPVLGALAALEAMHRRLGDEARVGRAGSRRAQATGLRRRLWRGTHYAYDDGGGPSSDSVMADQLAGQWYADATGLGDLVAPDRTVAALRTVHALNVVAFGDGLMGAVNGMRPDGTVDESSRAVSRGLGRDDLRAGRVHDRPRPARGGLGDGPRSGRRHLRARPLVPHARGVRPPRQLPGRACTSGRSRSGRSRKRSGAGDDVATAS